MMCLVMVYTICSNNHDKLQKFGLVYSTVEFNVFIGVVIWLTIGKCLIGSCNANRMFPRTV